MNKHNSVTSTYYLLLKNKKKRIYRENEIPRQKLRQIFQNVKRKARALQPPNEFHSNQTKIQIQKRASIPQKARFQAPKTLQNRRQKVHKAFQPKARTQIKRPKS
jgi:hypothetical protein